MGKQEGWDHLSPEVDVVGTEVVKAIGRKRVSHLPFTGHCPNPGVTKIPQKSQI